MKKILNLNLDDIQEFAFKGYKKNGYFDMWNIDKNIENKPNQQTINDVAEVGLINTEISEVLEELRLNNLNINKIGSECADVIIRTLNFMSRKGIRASFYFDKIISSNKEDKRGFLHGKRV